MFLSPFWTKSFTKRSIFFHFFHFFLFFPSQNIQYFPLKTLHKIWNILSASQNVQYFTAFYSLKSGFNFAACLWCFFYFQVMPLKNTHYWFSKHFQLNHLQIQHHKSNHFKPGSKLLSRPFFLNFRKFRQNLETNSSNSF